MAAQECVICAWRANCSLKFRYESSELHCREFTRDVTIHAKDQDKERPAADTKKEDTAE